jgi:hypothetical protein
MIRKMWSKLVSWGWEYEYETIDESRGSRGIPVLVDDDVSGIDLPDPIRFKVQTVSGGTVVETRWYDNKKGENRVKLHIITQDENVSDSIGKIVTMELLQR